jgi:hypothetical protein
VEKSTAAWTKLSTNVPTRICALVLASLSFSVEAAYAGNDVLGELQAALFLSSDNDLARLRNLGEPLTRGVNAERGHELRQPEAAPPTCAGIGSTQHRARLAGPVRGRAIE